MGGGAERGGGRRPWNQQGTAPGSDIAAAGRLLPQTEVGTPRKGAERGFAELSEGADLASLCFGSFFFLLKEKDKSKISRV